MEHRMKAIVCTALAVGMAITCVTTASALPPLPKYLEEHYGANPEYAKFVETFKALEMEHKCDACHKPGVDKKARGHALNDFGQAMHKHLNNRQFNAADKQGKDNSEEAAKAKKIVAEALGKAEGEMNAAGKTFAELMKAGQLPGKN
jgi:hypothetical protein